MEKLRIALHRERIVLRIGDIRYSISEPCKNKDWSITKRRIKSSRTDAIEMNEFLNRLDTFCTDINRKYVMAGRSLTFDTIEREYKQWKTGKAEDPITFIEFFEQFIILPRIIKGKLPSEYTLTGYKTTLSCLRAYMDASKIKTLCFSDITVVFYDKFVLYCLGRNFELNTVGDRIKNIKTVMGDAAGKGLHINFAYKSFVRFKVEKQQVYLTMTELRKIAACDLTERSGLEDTRDNFLILCFSSLRYGEYNRLDPANIVITEEGRAISIQPTKTSARVYMPLHPIIEDILKRHGGIPPKPASNQNLNASIKELCKLAGITDMVQKIEYKGGVRKDYSVPKYTQIKTHTGRRSFFTNAYLSGMDVYTLMLLSGKKTEREFFTYICIDREQAAMKAKDAAFFKFKLDEPNLKVV